MKKLSEVKWEAYSLDYIFDEIKRGKRLKNEDHIIGDMPYVSSSAMNNGVDDFVSNKEGVRIFNNCLTVANSGSVGTAFFQPFKFVASDHVTKLKNNKFNIYIYLFLTAAIQKQKGKYSFNREINDKRIQMEQVLLPSSPSGTPDYAFMEEYMRQVERRLLEKYKAYLDDYIEHKLN